MSNFLVQSYWKRYFVMTGDTLAGKTYILNFNNGLGVKVVEKNERYTVTLIKIDRYGVMSHDTSKVRGIDIPEGTLDWNELVEVLRNVEKAKAD